MDLQTYIKSFPRNQRTNVRNQLAEAHGVSEVTVRAWANLTRRHPYTLAAIEITERVTGHKVSRHNLRPEIFGEPAVESSVESRVEPKVESRVESRVEPRVESTAKVAEAEV